ncbi:uncharacterized protein LOC112087478 [Eutrema salsugineum]|uniref:uncharacterized protein LOC112087478 n=1 Tax=Eutrema salsugineum TaxID=72664 RepID=UPI000CED5F85|nr:uncharacterized protein LOC112087478 [Eutrema salsugineum]
MDPYWKELIGNDKKTTLGDIGEMLLHDKDMESGRRLRLALLLIVDGVLIANAQVHKPTLKYVKMLAGIDSFMAFPWGRGSFMKTICCMLPPRKSQGKSDATVVDFRQLLRQATLQMQGFPLVLQLVAFQAIPGLPRRLSVDEEHPTLLEWTGVKLPKNDSLSYTDVLDVEFDKNLVVCPLIPVDIPSDDGWGEFDDKIKDRKVNYLEELCRTGHIFSKRMWSGGDATEDLIEHDSKPVQRMHKKHLVDRKRKHPSTQI